MEQRRRVRLDDAHEGDEEIEGKQEAGIAQELARLGADKREKGEGEDEKDGQKPRPQGQRRPGYDEEHDELGERMQTVEKAVAPFETENL